jgi:F-type H+-transporting ATPase subunit gamma
MTARAGELQARRHTVAAFGDLVNAMRSVAAARAQRAQTLLAGVDAYAGTLTDAMAQARALMNAGDPLPSTGGGTATLTLVIGGEQGFNGGYSTQVLAAWPEAPQGRVLLLGTQALRLAGSRGCRPEWSAPMIAHADGAAEAAQALHEALGRALARQPAAAVDLVGAEVLTEPTGGQRVAPYRRRLLPLAWPEARAEPGPPPLLQLASAQVLDELGLEYVAAQLMRAILHGHAAENLSRLHAMTAASENVQRMVASLEADERRLRQEEITAEIIELAAGGRSP